MKKLLSIVVLVCIVMSMCTVSAWASPIVPPPPKAYFGPTTDNHNYNLTISRQFEAVLPDPEVFEYYKGWYPDFQISVNKPITFNANGGADGYLSGQYDDYGPGWVNVPFSDVTVPVGAPLNIMQYASTLLNQPGLNITYEEALNIGIFRCGVFIEPAFLAANPDFELTLTLNLYPTIDKKPSEAVKIKGTIYPEPVDPAPPAPANPVTPAAPVVEDIYYIPATDDNSNMALWSILALALLSTAFVTRKRKNEN